MNKDDYKNKMNALLAGENAYTELERDPVVSTTNKLRTILSKLRKSELLLEVEWKEINPDDPELFMLLWFFVEYLVRMWSAGCRSRYQTWRGRFRFARRPLCVVDMILMISSVIVLAGENDSNVFAASALRGLRFFQILRMIRVDRRAGSFKLLASVVWAHRQELFTTVYIGFLGLIFSSFLMYLVEKKSNKNINSYADALWWGVITLCTVGYGDTVPQTWVGKLIAAGCAFTGISFFALPAGILGSGFALKVQEHQRQKHLIRRRIPAATLIQCLWRCYAADKRSTSVATWDLYRKRSTFGNNFASVGSFTERTGFVRFGQRLSTIRRKAEKMTHSGQSWKSPPQIATHEAFSSESRSNNCDDIPSDEETLNFHKKMQKRTKYRNLDRAERGQITTMHSNEEGLDFLERSTSSSPPTREPTPSMVKSRRAAIVCACSPCAGTNFDSVNQLTDQDKLVIRVIRKIQLFVARRKFREALRPYDVKDVIEQYSAGHIDILSRVKSLQARLDQMLGRQIGKSETSHDVPNISLISRVIEIESSVRRFERKLDILLDLHEKSMTVVADSQHSYKSFQGRKDKETFHDAPTVPCYRTSTLGDGEGTKYRKMSESCDAVWEKSPNMNLTYSQVQSGSRLSEQNMADIRQTTRSFRNNRKRFLRCNRKITKNASKDNPERTSLNNLENSFILRNPFSFPTDGKKDKNLVESISTNEYSLPENE